METNTLARPKAARSRRFRWLRRAGIGAAVIVLAYTVFGFFGVPLVIRHVVVQLLPDLH